MSNFLKVLPLTIENEGGYILHEIEGDKGGRTFAGIAENFWSDWEGWDMIDDGVAWDNPRLVKSVELFYKKNFWDVQNLDLISDPKTAYTVFDFCMNVGSRTGARLAQKACGAKPDGRIGPKTAEALNSMDPEMFDKQFALEKMYRYAAIVRRDQSQAKFIGGWARRTEEVEKTKL